MFQALDDTAAKDGPHSARSQHKHDPSLGSREIDMLHKQYQEQMAERVKDLEM